MFCPIAGNAHKDPDNIAIIHNGKSHSYSHLNERIQFVQQYLLNSGVGVGERLAIIGDNSIEYIAFLFAIWRIRGIAFPINPALPSDELNQTLESSKTRFLITSKEHFKKVNSKNTVLIDIDFEAGYDFKKVGSQTQMEDNTACLYIMTSGSTSEKKIVALTFSNLIYSALGVLDRIDLQMGDRWLLSLPLFHVGGIGVLVRSFLKGATVFISNRRDSLLDHINKADLTHLSLVSTQLISLLNEINDGKAKVFVSSLKCLLLGGSSVSNPLLKEALKYDLPVFISFGLSEMASTVSILKLEKNRQLNGSSGSVLKYRKLSISDGMVLLGGKTLFQGYLKGETLSLPMDDNAMFRSGDLGYLDREGELFITGRSDNMFISGGENIQPEEIERIILEIPEIIEAKVLPFKNKKFGLRPAVFLKINNERLPDKESIEAYLKKKLPKFKIPDLYYPWPDISPDKIKPSKGDFEKLFKKKIQM